MAPGCEDPALLRDRLMVKEGWDIQTFQQSSFLKDSSDRENCVQISWLTTRETSILAEEAHMPVKIAQITHLPMPW